MRVLVIANPKSGSFNNVLLENTLKCLKNKFPKSELMLTEYQNHAMEISNKADHDLVIAAGGDGLINEVVNGLYMKKDVFFSALPFGTRNVYCRECSIPLDPIKAVQKIDMEKSRTIPLGFINNRAFILMCGFGFDANVVSGVIKNSNIKNKTIKHIVEGVNSLFKGYPKLTIKSEQGTFEAYHAIIAVCNSYAGDFKLSKNFIPNNLNVFYIDAPQNFSIVNASLNVAFFNNFPYSSLHIDQLYIEGSDLVQLDGEYFSTSTLTNKLYIKKDALRVV